MVPELFRDRPVSTWEVDERDPDARAVAVTAMMSCTRLPRCAGDREGGPCCGVGDGLTFCELKTHREAGMRSGSASRRLAHVDSGQVWATPIGHPHVISCSDRL